MNILISGGTGFIGSALCSYLAEIGHDIVIKTIIKTRHPELITQNIEGVSQLSQLSDNEKFDVVINLAGEPIANKRWSEGQRRKILESRINTTQEIIRFFRRSKNKPTVFISSSAIGYYGVGLSSASIDEACSGDDSFSSKLCLQWEECARQAQSLGIRTCLMRTGIVLGNQGGALQKMLPPFKLGLGGKMGSGKQWMSWIHLDDLIAIIDYCIKHEELNGPINCTAPNPVTNSLFTATLGEVLARPARVHIPAILIKLLMGEMGKELLLAGYKVVPTKIENAGFKFKYRHIKEALEDILLKHKSINNQVS